MRAEADAAIGSRRHPRAVVAIVTMLAMAAALLGISFGEHWDEAGRMAITEPPVRPSVGRRAVSARGIPGLARATARPLDAFAKANRPPLGYFAFLKSEVEHSDVRRWSANRLGAHRVFGPRDVNFDYYPTWRGHDRVIVLRWRNAQVLFDLE